MAGTMRNYYLGAAVIVAVCVVVVGIQASLGATVRYDEQIVTDLTQIETDISTQANSGHVLPLSLDGIATKVDKKRMAERGYEYHLLPSTTHVSSTAQDHKYQLCAVFKTNTLPTKQSRYSTSGLDYFNPSQHTKGRSCFTATVYIYGNYPIYNSK